MIFKEDSLLKLRNSLDGGEGAGLPDAGLCALYLEMISPKRKINSYI